jgi:hypothetical protein
VTPTTLEKILRMMRPRVPAGWGLNFSVLVNDDEDRLEVKATRFRDGAYGQALRDSFRHAVVTLDPRRWAYDDRVVINDLREAIGRLMASLFPPPLPGFRIGTRPHAKRWQYRKRG